MVMLKKVVFNGGSMVMLPEEVSIMEGECSLRRWPV